MTQVQKNLLAQKESWLLIADHVQKELRWGALPRSQPKQVWVVGSGSSYWAAALCQEAIWKESQTGHLRERLKGVPVVALTTTQFLRKPSFQPGDWVVVISHRCQAELTRRLLDRTLRSGVFTVVITGKQTEVPDWVGLTLRTVDQEVVEPHTISMTGAIVACCSLLMGTEATAQIEAQTQLKDPDLEHMQAKVGNACGLIVGEHASSILAKEAALKIMEMARVPVRSYMVDEYMHGPRYARGAQETLWWVKGIGEDQAPAGLKPNLTFEWDSQQSLGFLSGLVELQWASLALALNLGADPDFKGGA